MQAPGHVDLAFRHACLAHTQEAVDILIHDWRIASIVKSAQGDRREHQLAVRTDCRSIGIAKCCQ